MVDVDRSDTPQAWHHCAGAEGEGGVHMHIDGAVDPHVRAAVNQGMGCGRHEPSGGLPSLSGRSGRG